MQDQPDKVNAASSLFTAVIHLDKSLKITYISPLLGRYAPEIRCGQKLQDAFEMVRPRNLTSVNAPDKLEMIFLMLTRESRYPIRGQMLEVEDGFMLCGSPWLSRMTDDQIHEYELKDFPLHDAQLDWLFLLSGERQQVKDLKRLSKDLKGAKAEVESAIESKSNFFAVMSHEMRTPLNAIIGSINLMSRDEMNAEQNKLLNISVSAAQQLLSVINDVLDFSKMEAGKLEMEYSEFNLRNIVNDVLAIVNPLAIEKNLTLTATENSILEQFVLGDNGKIKQILLNLLANAIKFTQAGSVSLEVEEQRREGNISHIRISVSDTGIGISDKDKERLFQQFWTSSIEQGVQGRGTGLGLSISKRMAELMNGRIECESIRGKGSTFWIEIPFEVVLKPTKKIERSQDMEDAKSKLTGKRVLVAEDNQANQIIARLSLEKLGIVVEIANNGLEVLKALENAPYDAILMDIGMPHMNGIDTTRKIRTEMGNATLPIIACTAHSLSTATNSMEDPGFNGYVSKPIDKNDLISTLVEWIGFPKFEQSSLATHPNIAPIEEDDSSDLINDTDLNRLRNDIGDHNMNAAIEALIAEFDSRVLAIQAAHDDKNLKSLAEEAHALKSSALSFGASKLSLVVKRLELLAAQEDTTAFGLVSSVVSITRETRKAYTEL